MDTLQGERGQAMKSRAELADLLRICIEEGDSDGVWFVIGELERESE